MKNLLVVLIFSFGLTSCLKEQDTIAQISVVDQVGSPVANAQVVLLGVPSISNPPTVIRHDTLFTNSAGIATFNYTEEWWYCIFLSLFNTFFTSYKCKFKSI